MAPLSAAGTERARTAFALQLLFGLLPIPFIALRLWSRKLTNASLAINDWTILAALLVFWGLTANDLFAINSAGIGQHVSQLTPEEFKIGSVETLPPTVLWLVSTGLVRVSVLHFYLIIFASNKRTRYASYILMVISVCFCIGSTFAAVFFCRRIAAAWLSTIPNGACGDWDAFFLATAIISMLLDVSIVITPQPCLWSLHMPRDRKIPIAVIFAIGGVISLFSILRCWAVATIDGADLTYSILFDQFMTQLEPALGICNSCLPIMVPAIARASQYKHLSFLRHLIPKSSDDQLERMKRDSRNGSRWKLAQWWRSYRSDNSAVIDVTREVDQSSEYAASDNSTAKRNDSIYANTLNDGMMMTQISAHTHSTEGPHTSRVEA